MGKIMVGFLWLMCSVIFLIARSVSSQSNNETMYGRLLIFGTNFIDIKVIEITECVEPSPLVGTDFARISNCYPLTGCVNVYKEKNCTGDYLSVRRTTNVVVLTNYWRDETDKIASIGPCDQECIEEAMVAMPENQTNLVTFHAHSTNEQFVGESVTVDVKGCMNISHIRVNESIIGFNNASVCIELYESENCTGRSVRRAKGYVSRTTIHSSWTSEAGMFVSPCGYNCIPPNNVSLEHRKVPLPGPNTLSIYSRDENGREFENEVDIDKGCSEMDLGIHPVSIFVYKQCIILHTLPECSSSPRDPPLILNQSTWSPVVGFFEANGTSYRSVRACSYIPVYAQEINGDDRDEPTLLDVSKCVSSPVFGRGSDPYPRRATLVTTAAYNDCLNLYEDRDCGGRYIQKHPGQKNGPIFWTESNNERNNLGSIGPCDKLCSTNVPSPDDSVRITLYESEERQDNNATIDVSGCHVIPLKLRHNLGYFHYSDHSSCIEFYENSDCTGRFAQSGPSSKQLNVLMNIDSPSSSQYAAPAPSTLTLFNDPVRSVGLCGKNCTKLFVENKNVTSPGHNIVTLFDETDFKGHYKQLDLSEGCVELREEWGGILKSIRTYQQCITLYNLFGCSDSRFGQHLIVNEINSADHKNITFPVRAIQFCHRKSSNVYATIHDFESGKTTELDVSTCQSFSVNESLRINSAYAYNECFNAYEDQNCSGNYIPKIPVRYTRDEYREEYNFTWTENGHLSNSSIHSLGPCDDPCKSVNMRMRPALASNVVTLFDSVDQQGTDVTINVDGCLVIPRKLRQRVESVHFNDSFCIELHEHWNCTGRSVERGTGSRQLNMIIDAGVKKKFAVPVAGVLDWKDRVGSVSLCGYNCNRPCPKDRTLTSPGPAMVTIFDEPGFTGNSKDLNLKDGCVNITEEWDGESKSVLTYNKCVIVFSQFGCSESTESLHLNDSNTDSQSNLPFSWGIRSIKFCEGLSYLNDSTSWQTIGVLIAGLIVIGVVVVASMCFRRLKRRYSTKLSQAEVDDFHNGLEDLDTEGDGSSPGYSRPYDKKFEIPKDRLTVGSPLGFGQFAIVYKGSVKEYGDPPQDLEIAIKSIKPHTSLDFTRALLKEIKTMIYVGNQHRIVQLVGCCTENLHNGELYVMTELCENGCMEKFLRNNKEAFVNLVENDQICLDKLLALCTNNQGYSERQAMMQISSSNFNTIHLMQWSLQIAEGMDYLAYKKVVHADLATRNVLLATDFSIRISDFGLSRQMYQYSQYNKKTSSPLPWRWLAIETLKSFTFSTESDVWAFGVTLWEIFTLGDTPFPERTWDEEFANSLVAGDRLSKPKQAPATWWILMLECWNEKPSDRITFTDLRTKFVEILNMYSPSRTSVSNNPEELYTKFNE